MKKYLAIAAAASAAFAIPTLAQAAVIFPGACALPDCSTGTVPNTKFDVTGPTDGSGVLTASIGRSAITSDGMDVFTFLIGDGVAPVGDPIGFGTGSVTSNIRIGLSALTGLNFTEVKFWNGFTLFDIPVSPLGSGSSATTTTFIPIFEDVVNELRVTYDVSPTAQNARYDGNLTFIPGGVPEPATWGLMILGFAGIGAALRRRRKQPIRVKYAF